MSFVIIDRGGLTSLYCNLIFGSGVTNFIGFIHLLDIR